MKADKEIIMNSISNLGFEVFRNGQFHWNSSSTPDMSINEDGSISDLKFETKFQNSYNYKFKNYFEKKIKEFVLNSQWLPATSQGIIVKSEWNVDFHYK